MQCSRCHGWCRTLIGTNAPGHRSRLDLYWPKKRVLPTHFWHLASFGIICHRLASSGIIWHLTFGVLFDLPPELALVSTIALLRESFVAVFGQSPAPELTGQEPQLVDDDDADYTIPEHDEELTEKDIVKTLVLIGLFLLLKWISLDWVQDRCCGLVFLKLLLRSCLIASIWELQILWFRTWDWAHKPRMLRRPLPDAQFRMFDMRCLDPEPSWQSPQYARVWICCHDMSWLDVCWYLNIYRHNWAHVHVHGSLHNICVCMCNFGVYRYIYIYVRVCMYVCVCVT